MYPITEYTFQQDELRDKFLPKLREKVFHVTSYEGYKMIEKEGMIKSNANGKMGYTYPQSETSYGRKRGYICLFDLRSKTEDEIENAIECFYFLGDYRLGDKQTYLIMHEEIYADLIDSSRAKAEIGFKEMWIPNVECWYPRDLPLSSIKEIIVLNINRPKTIYTEIAKAIEEASKKFNN